MKTLRPGQSLSPIITNEIIGNAAIENEKSISSQAGLPVDNTDKRSLWRTAGVGSRLGKGNFNLLDSQMDSVHCKASPPSSHGRKNIPQNKQFIATALSMLVIALMYAS